MSAPDLRIEELIYKYLDGAANSEELTELRRELKSDPSIAERIFTAARTQVALAQLLKLEASARAFPRRTPSRQARVASPSNLKKVHRNPWSWRIGLVAAVLLLILTGYILTKSTEEADPVAEIAEVSNGTGTQSTLILANGSSQPAKAGLIIRAGTRLETGGATVHIKYADSTQLEAAPDAKVGFTAEGGAKRVALDEGSLKADVARQMNGKPMTIVTPRARVEVVGTHFALSHANNVTRIDMDEGAVKFVRLSDQRAIDVKADQYAMVGEGADFAAMQREPEANLLTNPGFERGGEGWLNVYAKAGSQEFNKDVSISGAHTGQRALYLNSTAGVDSVVQLIPIQAGETYEISGWLRVDAPKDEFMPKALIEVRWINMGTDELSKLQVSTVKRPSIPKTSILKIDAFEKAKLKDGFQLVSARFKAPAGARTLELALLRPSHGIDNFDDFSIRKLRH
jgi:ferric-dicitrate binding protein FerR (iron transport regulator)